MTQPIDPNAGLTQILGQFEAQIRNTPPESQATLNLLRNWLLPILTDFGTAINQTAMALGEVAQAAADAQDTAEKTMAGEQLASSADLVLILREQVAQRDYTGAAETLEVMAEILEDWMPAEDDAGNVEEPELEVVPPPVIVAVVPEPEPEEPAAKKPAAKKPAAKRSAPKKPAAKPKKAAAKEAS
jgi:hypothetical protein